MRHKISLPELINYLRRFKPDQGEDVYADWLAHEAVVRTVYFTWLPFATLGVDLAEPAVWVYSPLPATKIGQYLAVAGAVKDRFLPDVANVPPDHVEGHAAPPYFSAEVPPGASET